MRTALRRGDNPTGGRFTLTAAKKPKVDYLNLPGLIAYEEIHRDALTFALEVQQRPAEASCTCLECMTQCIRHGPRIPRTLSSRDFGRNFLGEAAARVPGWPWWGRLAACVGGAACRRLRTWCRGNLICKNRNYYDEAVGKDFVREINYTVVPSIVVDEAAVARVVEAATTELRGVGRCEFGQLMQASFSRAHRMV
ncbi:bacterial extracellular solute-binding s [Striga asiatica]|uniref:Bacterial extracellular solute-binding s n=1 Tax=Striga asiatica TaxID=4170 RepID=A0A5A7QLP8_STRAF|nr:bacterial extracellular solute-binding s [Striga asiatica]